MATLIALAPVLTAAAGAATAAGTIAANKRNADIAQNTNQQNIALAREQNQFNERMWHMNNAYNSPLNQARRLRQAGLSAAAAAQNIDGAGNSQAMQSADLSVAAQPSTGQMPIDFSFLNGANIIGVARAVQDLKQSKIQTKMLQNELNVQPQKIFCEQQLRELQVKEADRAFQQSVKEGPYHFKSLIADVKYKNQQIRNSKQEYKMMVTNWKIAKKELSWLERFKEAEYKKIWTDIAKSASEKKVLDQTWSRNEVLRAFDKFGGVPDSFAGRIAILMSTGVIKPEDIEENVKNFSNIVQYLLKGVKETLLPGALDILETMIFGPSEDDREIEEFKKMWQRKKGKQNAAGDHSAGSGFEEGYEPYD